LNEVTIKEILYQSGNDVFYEDSFYFVIVPRASVNLIFKVIVNAKFIAEYWKNEWANFILKEVETRPFDEKQQV
jgi:hypothetical protein